MGRFQTVLIKDRILEAMSYIYLFALCSFYIQIPGLYGDKGILPVNVLPITTPHDIIDFIKDPNLLRLHSWFNLDIYSMLEFVVAMGCALTLLSCLSSHFRNAAVLFTVWLVYYSCVKSGQVFLWFQWDLMLLEIGFLIVLLAKVPFVSKSNSASDCLALWMVRWLLFRLMFSAGVVKLTSNCTTWWNLSALNWHYQSQCIPAPLAWYFHHLPGWFHSLCVAATLAIEILFPLLFFIPLRNVRLFSFYSQVLLQILIMLTGNFNFFNMLTIVLCYSLLKDTDFKKNKGSGFAAFAESLLSWLIIGGTLGLSCYLFKIRPNSNFTVKASVGFSKDQFNWFVTNTVHYYIGLALALYLLEFFKSVICALRAPKVGQKLTELIGVFLVGAITFTLLVSSFVPMASLDGKSERNLPVAVHQVNKQLSPYHVTNSYGLFRRMTGIGGRPEVILSAAPSESGPWTEYHFRFKPGSLNRAPPIIIPHQPRLDWQMWFAALSSPDRQPWLYNLVYRLLQQEKDVLALLDTSSLPRNPKFIRAEAFTYHYTSPNDLKGKGNWWRRIHKQEYLSPMSLNSPFLKATVESNGLIGSRRKDPQHHGILLDLVKRLRSAIGQPPDLSPLLLVCVLVLITKFAFIQASATARSRLTVK